MSVAPTLNRNCSVLDPDTFSLHANPVYGLSVVPPNDAHGMFTVSAVSDANVNISIDASPPVDPVVYAVGYVYVVLPSFHAMLTLPLPVVCRDRAVHRSPVPTENVPAGIVTLYSAVIEPVPLVAAVGPWIEMLCCTPHPVQVVTFSVPTVAVVAFTSAA